MSFAANLRYLRHRDRCSQNSLAASLGYKSFTTIQKWEDGSAVPPYRTLQQLADFFHVTTASLMNDDLTVGSRPLSIPILGVVRGGEPIFAETNYIGYEPAAGTPDESPTGFYLQVVGDSMRDARILPGDLVYVRPQDYLDEGDIGVVLLEDEATIKRIHYQQKNMILTPANENYQPIILTPADIEARHVRIVGKVLYDKIRF